MVSPFLFPELDGHAEESATFHFDDEQFARAAAYGQAIEVAAGDVLFEAGDEDADLILVGTATVDVFRAAGPELITVAAADNLEIIADTASRDGLALENFLKRQALPHRWIESDTVEGRHALAAAGLTSADVPVVVTPRARLTRTDAGTLSRLLGLTYRRTPKGVADLTVIGAGPAGLAAAAYGASEGLETVLLDAVATGRQAAPGAGGSRLGTGAGRPWHDRRPAATRTCRTATVAGPGYRLANAEGRNDLVRTGRS